jgi:hypothetical protein
MGHYTSNSRLGQNKWQIGPSGVFGYLGEKWIAGVFPQQWFSVGGPDSTKKVHTKINAITTQSFKNAVRLSSIRVREARGELTRNLFARLKINDRRKFPVDS